MARKLVPTLALLGVLSGCNWYYDQVPSPDDLMKLVPWFDHMIKSPTPAPYGRVDIPRNTPRGTVPVTGGEADWRVGDPTAFPPVYAFDTLVAKALPNPGPAGAASLARGDTLYQTFCAVCHGVNGDGQGPVGVRLGAASLLTDKAKGYPDGYLYSLVRYGRGVMPGYGDKIHRQRDRWAVVNYLRQLQGLGGQASAPGAQGDTR